MYTTNDPNPWYPTLSPYLTDSLQTTHNLYPTHSFISVSDLANFVPVTKFVIFDQVTNIASFCPK